MIRLYNRYGIYAAVGREIGRSGSTVARYVKMNGVPQVVKAAVQNIVSKETIL